MISKATRKKMRAPRMTKIHLEEGTCRRGEQGRQVSHERFVDTGNRACLTCARICGCTECSDL